MAPPETNTRPKNHLLATLADADYALLQPQLQPIDLFLRRHLETPDQPVRDVVFPNAGLVSVVTSAPRGRQIEAGVIGREGMSGLPVVLASDRSPHAVFVQAAGEGLCIPADRLRSAMRKSASLHEHLLRFCCAFLSQTTNTVLANGSATIEERLARWLLLAHDRSDGDTLSLTHEFLALMLGVRRAGVTTSLHLLEAKGFVRSERGTVLILNRQGLIDLTNEVYGIAEAEYARLIGWQPRAAAPAS